MSDRDYIKQLRAHVDEGGAVGELAAKSLLAIAERLEKERFKYETCLMLISADITEAANIAKAALVK